MKVYSEKEINERIQYHGKRNSIISNKFAFVGLGLMGNRVIDAISQLRNAEGMPYYPTLAINTNKQDLDSITSCQNKFLLKGFKGAGRNPQIGYQAIEENKDEVKKAFREVSKGVDMTFIVAGLGGGTGTGSILSFAQWAMEMKTYLGVNFGLMVSIPRISDGRLENKNALSVLAQLNDLVASREIPIIVIDNEVLYEKYKQKREEGEIDKGIDWTEDSNLVISSTLHQLNLITSFTPYGNKNFDGEEFLRVLNTGGCITFARTRISLAEIKDKNAIFSKIDKSLKNGIITKGYNHKDEGISMGVSVIAPKGKGQDAFDLLTIENLESAIHSVVPHADAFWGTYEDPYSSNDYVDVFSIVSGMGLPKRIETISEGLLQTSNQQAQRLSIEIPVESEETEVTNSTKSLYNPFKESKKEKKLIAPFANSVGAVSSNSSLPDWLNE